MTIRQELEFLASNRVPGRHDMNGILLEIVPESDVLVVSCSGIVPKGRIIYAMENTTKLAPTNKLFICDKRSVWYYQGIEGLSSTFDETVDALRSIIFALNPATTSAIGTSGGGYMALALGALLRLDRTLGMSPQTIIGPNGRQAIGDDRWQPNMEVINNVSVPHDIRDLILASTSPYFGLIYPCGEALDAAHASRLEDIKNVDTFQIASSDHNIAGFLHRKGILQQCIDVFIGSEKANLASRLRAILSPLIV